MAERPVWLPDTKGFLAIAIIVLIGSLTFVLAFAKVDPPSNILTLLTGLIGALTIILKDVYSYFFNSTEASKEKDATIAQQSAALATSAPVVVVAPEDKK